MSLNPNNYSGRVATSEQLVQLMREINNLEASIFFFNTRWGQIKMDAYPSSGTGDAITYNRNTGTVYIADQSNQLVYVYSPDGTYLSSFSISIANTDIMFMAGDRIVLVDPPNQIVEVYNSDGTFYDGFTLYTEYGVLISQITLHNACEAADPDELILSVNVDVTDSYDLFQRWSLSGVLQDEVEYHPEDSDVKNNLYFTNIVSDVVENKLWYNVMNNVTLPSLKCADLSTLAEISASPHGPIGGPFPTGYEVQEVLPNGFLLTIGNNVLRQSDLLLSNEVEPLFYMESTSSPHVINMNTEVAYVTAYRNAYGHNQPNDLNAPSMLSSQSRWVKYNGSSSGIIMDGWPDAGSIKPALADFQDVNWAYTGQLLHVRAVLTQLINSGRFYPQMSDSKKPWVLSGRSPGPTPITSYYPGIVSIVDGLITLDYSVQSYFLNNYAAELLLYIHGIPGLEGWWNAVRQNDEYDLSDWNDNIVVSTYQITDIFPVGSFSGGTVLAQTFGEASIYLFAMGDRTKYGATSGPWTFWTSYPDDSYYNAQNDNSETPAIYDIDIGEIAEIVNVLSNYTEILS